MAKSKKKAPFRRKNKARCLPAKGEVLSGASGGPATEFSHVDMIRSLLLTVHASDRMHALIVEGAAGWGKTTSVDEAMRAAGVVGVHLGSYSTPLHLFNFLYAHARNFVVIDDCAGLFNDSSSMAILKAATWPQGGHRVVRWGSTSGRAAVEEFIFEGKLVIVCNSFPTTADAEAVRSRSFPCKIEMDAMRARRLLLAAATDSGWYPQVELARAVAEFLCSRLTPESLSQISYRTLQMGYELAMHNGESWQELLGRMTGVVRESPEVVIQRLARQGLQVKDQFRLFSEATGLKRRTFFKYRKELGMGT